MRKDRPTFDVLITLEDLFEDLRLPNKHLELGPYRKPVEGEKVAKDQVQRGMVPVRLYGLTSTKSQDNNPNS